MASCRSCGAEILWAETVNGKRIPLDAEPAERPQGVFKLIERPGNPTPLATSAATEPVYLSHFVTCPNADEWRRPRDPSAGWTPQEGC